MCKEKTSWAGHFLALDMLIGMLLVQVFNNKGKLRKLDGILKSMIPPEELQDSVSMSHRSVIENHRAMIKKQIERYR